MRTRAIFERLYYNFRIMKFCIKIKLCIKIKCYAIISTLIVSNFISFGSYNFCLRQDFFSRLRLQSNVR